MHYFTLQYTKEVEFTEKKSVFIGVGKRVFSEDEAREFIDEMKRKYKDARHHVYAYTLFEDMNIQRYSDDGEPQGTGGIPVLDVIKKNDLRNVCIVVIRYFGGVLLGAGGLTRAYVKGAAVAVEASGIIKRVEGVEAKLPLSYDHLGRVEHYLLENKIKIIEAEYTEMVSLTLYLKREDYDQVKDEILNLTSGQAELGEGAKEMFYVKDNQLLKEI
ncbi:MAG: YigZ family protein [Clostridium sp.]|nr:YigZ family protein [Clostridium sp.]